MTSTSDDRPWLLVVDPQRIFADPASDWASSVVPPAMTRSRRPATRGAPEPALGRRGHPPADRSAGWGDYFRAWPFADAPASRPLDEPVDEARELSAHPTIDEPTFGKWGPQLAEIVGPHPHLLLTGVSTDCCVITTALAAADAGARLSVVQDACAASTAAEIGRASCRASG